MITNTLALFSEAAKSPVASATDNSTPSEMVWYRNNLQTLISAQLVEKQRKVAGAKAVEAAKKAGALIADYQQKFGDTKETLKRLADKISVNVSTLYRWRRVHEGKPGTKSSTRVVEVRAVVRKKSNGLFLEFGYGKYAKWTDIIKDATPAGAYIKNILCKTIRQADNRAIADARAKAPRQGDAPPTRTPRTRDDWEFVEVKVTYTLGKSHSQDSSAAMKAAEAAELEAPYEEP